MARSMRKVLFFALWYVVNVVREPALTLPLLPSLPLPSIQASWPLIAGVQRHQQVGVALAAAAMDDGVAATGDWAPLHRSTLAIRPAHAAQAHNG
eukprot:scaffold126201_cov34-Tisochrysis_lutea.AAC.1